MPPRLGFPVRPATDRLNSEAALATLLDNGTQGDRTAEDGVFSGLINLHELEPGQTMFYVRGEATGPAQETADFGSAPAELEFFRLTECQGMNLGLSFLFSRDTTPSGVGPLAVQPFPSVPFLNVGFFEQLDPSRLHASCDPSGIDRLLSVFWGSQDVIIVGALDSESAPAEDVDPDPGQDNPIKRIVDALQRIGKDNCIDANDAEDLREVLDALDEIADSDTLRQFLADTDWEGSLDEGQRLIPQDPPSEVAWSFFLDCRFRRNRGPRLECGRTVADHTDLVRCSRHLRNFLRLYRRGSRAATGVAQPPG